jgi:hypothetical protein
MCGTLPLGGAGIAQYNEQAKGWMARNSDSNPNGGRGFFIIYLFFILFLRNVHTGCGANPVFLPAKVMLK